jgi:hypothetical protein
MAGPRHTNGARKRSTSAARSGGHRAAAGNGTVRAWQDDPLGYAPPPLDRPIPNLALAPLKLRIKGTKVPSGAYAPGTAQFRYWAAAEALRRGADFWAPLLGVHRWQPGAVLRVGLDEGDDLNAYYDRSELAFFHSSAGGKTVYSGESPDVVCHELGHACLDAHRPELWDAPFIEAGAFHESFGDMSAILSALQLTTVRGSALAAVKRHRSSELSRLAEQLGWAIRQTAPAAVDPDCLRNAYNPFHYVDPNTLPDSAPANRLCAEVHSFSRVFTGAFYDALSGMLRIRSSKPSAADLATVAADLGRLLVDATGAAPVVPSYFAQVAAHLIDADAARFGGKYRSALVKAFVGRKIIPQTAVDGVVAVTAETRREAAKFAAARMVRPAPRIVTFQFSAKDFGLGDRPLHVDAPIEQKPAHTLSVAITQERPHEDDGAAHASARRFVEVLFAHHRVAVEPQHGARSASPEAPHRHTHAVVAKGGALKLVRRRFDCGRG